MWRILGNAENGELEASSVSITVLGASTSSCRTHLDNRDAGSRKLFGEHAEKRNRSSQIFGPVTALRSRCWGFGSPSI